MGIGAIMFEDRLDKDQCARLVDRLSHTTFPFMCAHGRPSMVPLVIMGRDGRRGSGRWIGRLGSGLMPWKTRLVNTDARAKREDDPVLFRRLNLCQR